MQHKNVTLVDIIPDEDFYKDLTFFSKPMLDMYLEKYGVVRRGNCAVQEFVKDGVVIKNAEGQTETLPADTAVLAFGIRPNTDMIAELSSVVPATYVIGDAKKVGVIGDSINQAYWLCRELDY